MIPQIDKDQVTSSGRFRRRLAYPAAAVLPFRPRASLRQVMWLATHNTERGGTGSAEAKAQQEEIVRLLEQQVRTRP
jgi:hypothetical protein